MCEVRGRVFESWPPHAHVFSFDATQSAKIPLVPDHPPGTSCKNWYQRAFSTDAIRRTSDSSDGKGSSGRAAGRGFELCSASDSHQGFSHFFQVQVALIRPCSAQEQATIENKLQILAPLYGGVGVCGVRLHVTSDTTACTSQYRTLKKPGATCTFSTSAGSLSTHFIHQRNGLIIGFRSWDLWFNSAAVPFYYHSFYFPNFKFAIFINSVIHLMFDFLST